MGIARIATGIKGFDKLIEGGLPQGTVTLLAGGAGTGKTIFSMEAAYRNAKAGKRTLFIGTEQGIEELKQLASQFSWNIKGMESIGKFKFAYFDFTKHECKITNIEKICKDFKPEVVIIDSLTTILDSYLGTITGYTNVLEGAGEKKLGKIALTVIQYRDNIINVPITKEMIVKQTMYDLFNTLKRLKCTSLITTEAPEEPANYITTDGVSEYMADGVVVLHHMPAGERRTLTVRKMRNTKCDGTPGVV